MVNDNNDNPDYQAPPEIVLAGLGWLAGLVVIACSIGPEWAAALLAISAALFAANATYGEWRITRRIRTESDDTEQGRHLGELPPAGREMEIRVRDLERDWNYRCDTTLIPDAELTTTRRIMRLTAEVLLTLVSAILAATVQGMVLLSPSIAIGLTLWWGWHAGLLAVAAALAALPLGHVLTQYWPRGAARLHKSIHKTVLQLTPLA